jgi:hypothetical protein
VQRTHWCQKNLIVLIKGSKRITQNNFIDGLKDLKDYVVNKYNKDFGELDFDEQVTVVDRYRKNGKNFQGVTGKVRNKILGKSFFNILKEYVTISYCTSMIGATTTLNYVSIPGRYDGCIAMARSQRSWATK